MNHLIISREYPPAAYSAGGIGAYVEHIARLLAEHGETVHVIAQLWPGAPHRQERRLDGRLIIHRVPLDEPLPLSERAAAHSTILNAFSESVAPSQAFQWQAALLASSLVDSAAIDVVEAQDYEAPAYYLQLRRARGDTSGRRVPVIVHLHSPTEFVFEHNEWDRGGSGYLALKRLEDFTIRAADALVCPSQFLAGIAEPHYRLAPGSVEVIPYPLGDSPVLRRSEATWRDGAICYVGRLEPRKGVRAWTDAAVALAAQERAARFIFIGSDTSLSGTGGDSMREALQARIPTAMKERFSFLGAIPRLDLAGHLEHARIAVVPSRWENFPYACMEAMASGLPVLVSPTGGMAEMVEDGRTGWIAAGHDASSLEATLRHALATPPRVLAEMGAAAAASIRASCGAETIVHRQIDFRRRVVSRGCRDFPAIARIATTDTDTAEDGTGSTPPLVVRLPELAICSADEIALLQHASLQRRTNDGTSLAGASTENGLTLTPLDILRASPRQKLAVVRRALSDPAYIGRWLMWHGRRAIGRIRRP